MTNNELKTTLLNELEENGEKIIREGLMSIVELKKDYNLYLTYKDDNDPYTDPDDDYLGLEYDWEGNGFKTELYNFGDSSYDSLEKYMILHKELLNSGITEEKDFENWYLTEFIYRCDDEIRTIKEIVENKINELF